MIRAWAWVRWAWAMIRASRTADGSRAAPEWLIYVAAFLAFAALSVTFAWMSAR